MSNGERSSGDLVVNVFSGLGLLLGLGLAGLGFAKRRLH